VSTLLRAGLVGGHTLHALLLKEVDYLLVGLHVPDACVHHTVHCSCARECVCACACARKCVCACACAHACLSVCLPLCVCAHTRVLCARMRRRCVHDMRLHARAQCHARAMPSHRRGTAARKDRLCSLSKGTRVLVRSTYRNYGGERCRLSHRGRPSHARIKKRS
jgi:hypothetical protein